MNLPVHPGAKKDMLRTLHRAIEIVESLPTRRDCDACDHFVDRACRLWNANPPAEVIAVGCESFTSTIPF